MWEVRELINTEDHDLVCHGRAQARGRALAAAVTVTVAFWLRTTVQCSATKICYGLRTPSAKEVIPQPLRCYINLVCLAPF
jgi:hypothetical protein